MRAYLVLLKSRMLVLFQYKTAALAGLATQFFWGLIKVMIFTAFYASTTQAQPLTLAQLITFVWLSQSLIQLLPWTIDKEIEADIRNGNVAYELTRPLDLYWYWFFRSLALRITPTLLRALPLFVFAGLFFDLSMPVSFSAAISFFSSLILASLLSAAVTNFFIISLFWTLSSDGIMSFVAHTMILLSGLLIPLPLFPSFLQPFLNFQPIHGIIDIPARLYTGVIPTSDAFYYLCFQMTWIVFFVALGKSLLSRAMKKFVIQGG